MNIEDFSTIDFFAKKWGISERTVQIYCSDGRIPGAVKIRGIWHLPSSTAKPKRIAPGVKTTLLKDEINVLSLFSGCGGLDLGFEGGFKILKHSFNEKKSPWCVSRGNNDWIKLPKTRFNTIFANDIVPEAKSTWTNYFSSKGIPSSVYCLDSIVDLVKLHKNNKVKIFPCGVDVVTGGFPCQDFSVSGKRKGFDSEVSHNGKHRIDEPSIESRGQLYMWMKEVIAITKPKLFVAENVKGLANLSDVKAIIEKDFANTCDGGYIVIPAKVLLAADYGVPQSRERIIFFGFRKSALRKEALEALSQETVPQEYDPYPIPTHSRSGENGLKPYVTTFQCLSDLPEPEDANDINQKAYSKAKYLGNRSQGQTEINLNGIGPTIRSEHHGNIEFRRLSAEHGGMHTRELDNGQRERRLTIRECARIQTFPDDYDFIIPEIGDNKAVSASSAYKLIGNAVPPLLGFHIAMRLQELWDEYFLTK